MSFTGKYLLESQENYEEFLEAIGLLSAKTDHKVVTEVVQDGDHFTWSQSIPNWTWTNEFTVGKECELQTMTGSKFTAKVTMDSGKLWEKSYWQGPGGRCPRAVFEGGAGTAPVVLVGRGPNWRTDRSPAPCLGPSDPGSVLRVVALADVPAHALVPPQGPLVHVVVENLQLLQLRPFHLKSTRKRLTPTASTKERPSGSIVRLWISRMQP
ncbi:hypothetical protein CRUP_010160 [Coryphaenoides rupestris]|nr:hypothetical protein CRUP_010160 [Coryphaenoides rupestris]